MTCAEVEKPVAVAEDEAARLPSYLARKGDIRLPGKGSSNYHGARPFHLIITMIKWIRTSRLSIHDSLSLRRAREAGGGGGGRGGAPRSRFESLGCGYS